MALTQPKIKLLQFSCDKGIKTNSAIPSKYKPPYKIAGYKTTPAKERVAKNPPEDQVMNRVLSVISTQGQELCLNEELWNKAKNQKHLVETCMTPAGRSSGVTNSYPTIDQIETWAGEKKFWLTYLPRQQRIWGYKSGDGRNWDSYSNLCTENESPSRDALTGESISFDERCRRYHKQVEWEEKVMTQFENKNQVRNDRLRNRELTLTLRRYKDFTRRLMGNLKDVQTETNHLASVGSRLNRRYQQSEMERIEKGYSILKDLYAMNPTLVTQLATQHVKGPPGKQWMGLSRDDISKVLEHLANSEADPDYCPFPNFSKPYEGRDPKTGAYSLHDYLTSRRLGQPPPRSDLLTSKTKEVSRQPQVILRKVRGPKRNRPLKPHQLMPRHVPGPDRLHQNICVRAYSAEMDGPDSDVEGGMSSRGGSSRNTVREVTPGTAKFGVDACDNPNVRVDTLEKSGEETLGFESREEDDEGLTIESFLPCFMNSH